MHSSLSPSPPSLPPPSLSLSIFTGGKVRYLKRLAQSNGGPVEEVRDEGVEEEEGPDERWPFPPTLDQFNLMESDVDPSDIEKILEDSR